jgi:hypothetical protein
MKIQAYHLICLIIVISTQDPVLERHTLQVYGNASMGYYYANIYIGYPPQEQSVIIDTGSGQLAMPCTKCTEECSKNHINQYYDLRKSNTAKFVTCVNIFSYSKPKIIKIAFHHVRVYRQLILVHLLFHMLKEVCFQESLLKILFNCKKILKMKQ